MPIPTQECDNCRDIILRERFYSMNDYLNCLDYIAGLVAKSRFEIVSQTCDTNEVENQYGHWVDDIIVHRIKCLDCGKVYEAFADTYHGNGSFSEV